MSTDRSPCLTPGMERMYFLEGAIASEDLLALRNARELGLDFEEKILVGSPVRCAVYRYLIEQEGIGGRISIVDEAASERATVAGSLKVMTERMSGAQDFSPCRMIPV